MIYAPKDDELYLGNKLIHPPHMFLYSSRAWGLRPFHASSIRSVSSVSGQIALRVFHKLMLMQHEEDFLCKNSDMSDKNFDQYSNPPSPLTSTNSFNYQNINYDCKTAKDVKEEAGVEEVIPVSIKILKPTMVKVNKNNSEDKPDWRLTNAPKWDLWKHWDKHEGGLCICKYCGQTRNNKEGNDIRRLRNHTKLMHWWEYMDHSSLRGAPRFTTIAMRFSECVQKVVGCFLILTQTQDGPDWLQCTEHKVSHWSHSDAPFTVSGQDVVPVLHQVPRVAGDLACLKEHMGQHTAGTQGSQGVKQPTPMIVL